MNDERAAEGLEHLQAAALEMIAAARAFLDVAEDLVTDTDRVSDTLTGLAALVDLAGRSARRPAGDHPFTPPAEGSGGADGPARIRRIEVS